MEPVDRVEDETAGADDDCSHRVHDTDGAGGQVKVRNVKGRVRPGCSPVHGVRYHYGAGQSVPRGHASCSTVAPGSRVCCYGRGLVSRRHGSHSRPYVSVCSAHVQVLRPAAIRVAVHCPNNKGERGEKRSRSTGRVPGVQVHPANIGVVQTGARHVHVHKRVCNGGQDHVLRGPSLASIGGNIRAVVRRNGDGSSTVDEEPVECYRSSVAVSNRRLRPTRPAVCGVVRVIAPARPLDSRANEDTAVRVHGGERHGRVTERDGHVQVTGDNLCVPDPRRTVHVEGQIVVDRVGGVYPHGAANLGGA